MLKETRGTRHVYIGRCRSRQILTMHSAVGFTSKSVTLARFVYFLLVWHCFGQAERKMKVLSLSNSRPDRSMLILIFVCHVRVESLRGDARVTSIRCTCICELCTIPGYSICLISHSSPLAQLNNHRMKFRLSLKDSATAPTKRVVIVDFSGNKTERC